MEKISKDLSPEIEDEKEWDELVEEEDFKSPLPAIGDDDVFDQLCSIGQTGRATNNHVGFNCGLN